MLSLTLTMLALLFQAPHATVDESAPRVARTDGVAWARSWEEALAQARKSRKKILLVVGTHT